MSVRRAALLGRRGLATPAQPSLDFTVNSVNGFKLAAQDDLQSPTGALTLALKAGPRYESAPGLAHVLKNFVFRATNRRSAIRLIRETEVYGGVLSSALSREHIFLTAEFLRGDEEYFAEILGEVLSEARLATHEYTESVLPQLQSEYAQAMATPEVFALDVAHQLAFRSGLGNSMFATPHTEVPYALAVDYAKATFSAASKMAVVASNVSASSLQSLVGEYFQPGPAAAAGTAPTPNAASDKYYGGEVRVPATAHGGHGKGFLLVAFKGGAASQPEYSVLRHLLGGEAAVKWSTGASGLGSAAPGATAFNLAYSDAGLIGFNVSAPTENVEGIAQKAVQEFKRVAKGGLKEDEVKRAIAKAKFEAASLFESRVPKLELVASQILSTGNAPTLSSTFAALDKVSGDAIAKAAASALKSTPTFVAVGNTHVLPYTDSLGL